MEVWFSIVSEAFIFRVQFHREPGCRFRSLPRESWVCIVTPGFVPRVDSKLIVLAVLGAPSNQLDYVTIFSVTRSVLVNTWLVSVEVHVNGESRGDGAVVVNVLLDVVDAGESVIWRCEVVVVGVVDGGVWLASRLADCGNCWREWTVLETFGNDVVGAAWYSVVETEPILGKVPQETTPFLMNQAHGVATWPPLHPNDIRWVLLQQVVVLVTERSVMKAPPVAINFLTLRASVVPWA